VTGAGGLPANVSQASVTSVSTAGSTGTSTLTVDATKATFTGGAGVDNVTLSAAAPSKAIDLGAGNDTLTLASGTTAVTGTIVGGNGTDTLVMVAADAGTGGASGSATFAGKVSGFEKLQLTSPGTVTVAADVLGNYNYIKTAGATALTLTGLTSGATLELTGAGTAYDVSLLSAASVVGTTDVLNIVTSNGTGAGINFASTGVTIANTETVAITTADTQNTPTNVMDSITLTDAGNSAKVVTVAGTDGLNLTFTGTGATTVDASGITAGGFTWVTGATTSATTVKGSATGTNTITLTNATKADVYTGGTGTDTVHLGASAQNHTLNLGAGNGVVDGASTGNNTITLASSGAVAVSNGATGSAITVASGNNTVTDTGSKGLFFTATTGANTVTTGSGADFITVTSGNNTISTGAGVDTITVGSGSNTVTMGAGSDVFTLSAVNQSSAIFTTITDIGAGDTIVLPSTVFANATGKLGAKLVSGIDDYQTFLNSAASQGVGVVSWFQTGGNTYIVEDNSAAAIFTGAADTVIKLTGLVDLSNSTLVNGGHTITIV